MLAGILIREKKFRRNTLKEIKENGMQYCSLIRGFFMQKALVIKEESLMLFVIQSFQQCHSYYSFIFPCSKKVILLLFHGTSFS